MDNINNTDLQFLFVNAGFEVQSYSGRGMYGKQCLALTVDREDSVSQVFAELLDQATELNDLDDMRHMVEVIKEGMKAAKTDSLGRDQVLYFPNVEYVDIAKRDFTG